MNPREVLTLLPPRGRLVLYVIYGCLGLAGVAAVAFYSMSPYEAPWWIGAGLAGLGARSPAFSAIAGSNVLQRGTGDTMRVDVPVPDEVQRP